MIPDLVSGPGVLVEERCHGFRLQDPESAHHASRQIELCRPVCAQVKAHVVLCLYESQPNIAAGRPLAPAALMKVD